MVLQETNIHDLPEEIILSIMSKLKLKDVVNFSIVSKQWVNVKYCLETIAIDTSMLLEDGIQKCSDTKLSFVEAVNQFLYHYIKFRSMLALPISLHKFVICFCLDRHSEDVDAWISMAISNGISTLILNLECTFHQENGSIRPHKDKYIFPWLKVHKAPSALKRLVIRTCVFECRLASVWTSLENLELSDTLLTQYDMDRILYCFPNLQKIVFAYCKVPVKLTFAGGILSCLMVLYCTGVKEIEVLDAWSLREFSFKGRSVRLNLTNASQITNVTFGFYNANGVDYVFQNLHRDFPAMRNLSIFSHCKTLPPLSHLYGRMMSFLHLEELNLYNHPDCGLSLQIMAELLKACPYLRRLEMVPSCTVDVGNGIVYPVQYPHKCLEFIKISGFCGSFGNVELVKFLVQVSETLLHIVIEQKAEIRGYIYIEHSTSWHGQQEPKVIEDDLLNSMKSGKLTFLRL